MMFPDCPACLDDERTVRYGLPAEVWCRFGMRSTGGPPGGGMIRCPAGHWFNGPVESLTRERTDKHHPGRAAGSPSGRQDTLHDTHEGRDTGGGFALGDFPAGPEREIRRPGTVPACYLSRPTRLWAEPLLDQPALASRYRLLSYHRADFAGSGRLNEPATMAAHAAHCHMPRPGSPQRTEPASTWFQFGPSRAELIEKDGYLMTITAAEKVLIAGGVLNLAYGVLLGYAIVVARMKGAPATPKYLMAAHLSTLLHAAVLLGLVWAAWLSTLGPGWLVVAAWLAVAASALIAAKDTLNWLTGVQDEFGEEPKYAAPLAGLAALAETTGIGIFVAGVLTAL